MIGQLEKEDFITQILNDVEYAYGMKPSLDNTDKYDSIVAETIIKFSPFLAKEYAIRIIEFARERALRETEKYTRNAPKADYLLNLFRRTLIHAVHLKFPAPT